jgi:hypothetical protein
VADRPAIKLAIARRQRLLPNGSMATWRLRCCKAATVSGETGSSASVAKYTSARADKKSSTWKDRIRSPRFGG